MAGTAPGSYDSWFSSEQKFLREVVGMKVIFLDIDGVLINRAALTHIPFDRERFDPLCVKELNRIIKETGACIVITSVWRFAGPSAMQALFRRNKVIGDVIDVTPHRTGIRGLKIQAWIDTNISTFGFIEFVIIDDDTDMGELLPFLVQTKFELGLTREKANEVIEKFNLN